MKVPQIPYKRYTIEALKNAFEAFRDAAERATSAADVLAARTRFLGQLRDYGTAVALANCRFTLDTRDEFYAAEVEYYDEIGPMSAELQVAYGNIMLNTPYRAEMEKTVNLLCYKKYEFTAKTYQPIVEADCQEENALVTEYSKFMSSLPVMWQGESKPLSYVRGFLEDADREVRRAAAFAIGEALGQESETLDSIYDRLVKVRDRIARKLGYKNYIELGYYRMDRIDYDREMIERFRQNVVEDLVPVVEHIKKDLAEELGIDCIRFYDDAVYIKGGNPRPRDGAEGIFREAKAMYDEMNPEIGAFMREMVENEAFDVEARDGKWGGGYCTGFDSYCQPFILANFNGSAGDIDVITHEFGHAFAAKKSYDGGDFELSVGGMETAECHSMSMEFFCEKYMERFFDKPVDYCKSHLLSALAFIPYGCIVDEFQHIVYEHPEYTPAERNAAYLALEAKYRPYLHMEGIPYLEGGTRWQYQMHIFESPFYYIDYCLAQTVSLGFLVMMKENYNEALEKYIAFVRAGGTKRFSELVREAGVADPFGTGTLAALAEKLCKIADEYK